MYWGNVIDWHLPYWAGVKFARIRKLFHQFSQLFWINVFTFKIVLGIRQTILKIRLLKLRGNSFRLNNSNFNLNKSWRTRKFRYLGIPDIIFEISYGKFVFYLQMYLDELEMHSIFTPDKQTKPKEIFTQCHVCGKYVIVRMCPETGVYSKCRYCFNSPFSNTEDVIFENLNVLPDGIEPEVTITTMDLNVPNEEPAPPPPQASGANGGGHSKSNGSFKCEHCGKLFTRNWYLKQHIKLHSNDKPYSCEMCDKRFLNSSNLKQHMKTHSVEYRCHICNRTYHSQSVLNQHLCKN